MLNSPKNFNSKNIPDLEISKLQSQIECVGILIPDNNKQTNLSKEIETEIIPYKEKPTTSKLEFTTTDSDSEGSTLDISKVAGTEREMAPAPQISTGVGGQRLELVNQPETSLSS
ncbi:hypothetical protein AOL_s00091g70 [Orbilia oligospora ATCC 24927]|uniref:Uncharacterized protein n=1 Tax=Arthrobotrys oligospora (strain ATCC 24927 / CBS 115.81 / DSM 1491) TaxID=756982 RepID=G1XI18_ARTOA|nr:hypothetical protein AOL_s00091g70 [Orbilia oligospora ATCC 24927]EGX47249.1 hypothetical protein AOL_s00091g70 [Orbilia oligospora ATCC 24927]